MQLPHENSLNTNVKAAAPSSIRQMEPKIETFLHRSRDPPTFFQMLSNLTDSPVRPVHTPSDPSFVSGNDDVPTTASDYAPQTSTLVDATMDGCDPPEARRHLTRFYPSGTNTSAVQAPVPADLVEPKAPPGMVPEFQVTLVGPVVGIFVHWYATDVFPREAHPLVFTHWSKALRYYRQMYAANQVSIRGNLVGTAAPVAPLAVSGASSTTANSFPPIRPFNTPTGKRNDPILIASASPLSKKRIFKPTSRTHVVKGKKRAKVQKSSSPIPQPQKSTGPTTGFSSWPTVIVVSDSEEEAAPDVAPAPTVASPAPPAPAVTPVNTSGGHLPSSDKDVARTPRPTTRRRPRASRTGKRTGRGQARRDASPHRAPSPDDMFLPNTPPKNPNTPIAITTPVNTQHSVDAMLEEIFASDSSDELPLSLFSAATRVPAAPVVNSPANLGNEPVLSQNTSGTPLSNRATRGLSSPVVFSSQPSKAASNSPSTSRLLSPRGDRAHTPLHFPSSPLSSRTPQGFSPNGLAHPGGFIPHRHLNNEEFDFFLEQALSSARHD